MLGGWPEWGCGSGARRRGFMGTMGLGGEGTLIEKYGGKSEYLLTFMPHVMFLDNELDHFS